MIEDIEKPLLTDWQVLKFSSIETLNSLIKESEDKEFSKEILDLQEDGFKSLLPVFNEDDIESKQEYIQKKNKRIKKDFLISGKTNLSKSSFQEIDELSDNLILDERFASLLNEDRSIQLGDSIYRYTPIGIFRAHYTKLDNLKEVVEQTIQNKGSFNGKSLIKQNKQMNCLETSMSFESNVNYVEQDLSNDVSLIQVDYCGGGGYSGGGGYTPSTPTVETYPFDIKKNLGTCIIRDESLWQKIFGEAETCHDYYADDRRIRTKFWNQNYFIFSSIGTSVKHQKRNWGIWDASDAVDYVELGINEVTFTYQYESSYLGQVYNDISNRVLYRYKGKIYKEDGSYVTDMKITVPNWPFESDDPLIDGLEIYIFGNDILSGLKWKEANKIIRDQAKAFITQLGNSLETNAKNDNVEISAIVMDPTNRTALFSRIGRLERDGDGTATYYFDFNFLVSTKFDLNYYSASCATYPDSGCQGAGFNVSGFKTDVINAKSYKNVKIDFYGVGRRDGNKYRGNRMVTENVLQ